MSQHVQGYCPMGCGRTLFLAPGGRITCSNVDCPDASCVDQLLEDSQAEHVITFHEGGGFTITHPLRERRGDIAECELHLWLAAPKPPVKPGRYCALRVDDGSWRFTPLEARP